MLTACGFKVFWAIMSTDAGDPIQRAAHLITCIDYIVIAVILFMSMRGNEKVKYYFGFLDGQYSKAFFLLFCSVLVWPIHVTDVDGNGKSGIVYFLQVLSCFLVFVAIAQLIRICTGNKEDSNSRDPMMDDDENMSMKIDQSTLM